MCFEAHFYRDGLHTFRFIRILFTRIAGCDFTERTINLLFRTIEMLRIMPGWAGLVYSHTKGVYFVIANVSVNISKVAIFSNIYVDERVCRGDP